MRQRIFRACARFAIRHYIFVLSVAVLLTAGSITLTCYRGKLATDLRTLLPPGAKYCDSLRLVMEEFGSSEELLVVIEGESREAIEEAKPLLKDFAERLKEHKDLVIDVHYRVGEEQERFVREHIAERAFLYLDEEDFPLVEKKFSYEGMKEELTRDKALFNADASLFRQRALPDPLNFLELFERYSRKMGGTYKSSGADRYLVTPDGLMMIATVRATGIVQDMDFTHRLMNTVYEDGKAVFGDNPQGITVGYGGGYAVAVQEEKVLKHDIIDTFALSMVLVLLVFALPFRRYGMAFYVGVPLAMSVAWTAGLAFLVFGRISIISGGFGAILVGLGIDFAIQIYNRHIEEHEESETFEQALENAAVKSSEGIFFGALTTAIAFFAVMITKFQGLYELGFLGGAGIMFAMVVMMQVFPALLVAREKITHKGFGRPRVWSFGLKYLNRFIQGHAPGITMAIFGTGVLACAYVLIFITTDEFDSEFRNLRPKDDPVFALQDRVMEKFDTNIESVLVMTSGNSTDEALEEARGVVDRLAKPMSEGRVLSYESLLDYLPAPSEQKRAVEFLRRFDLNAVEKNFDKLAAEQGFREGIFKEFHGRLASIRKLSESPQYVTLDTLKEAGFGPLLERFYSVCDTKGHLILTYVHPERGGHPTRWYNALSGDLGVNDKTVSMTSVRQVGYELRDIVYGDFTVITLLVLAGTIICHYMTFGSVLVTLVSFLPLVAGMGWMMAIMMLVGWKLNYVNVIMLPMIIGIGIDSAIHIIHRYMDEREVGGIVELMGRAVVMTGLTTFMGFGSLVISNNRGIISLGIVASLGVTTCLIASLVGLPALLHWLGRYIVRGKAVETSEAVPAVVKTEG